MKNGQGIERKTPEGYQLAGTWQLPLKGGGLVALLSAAAVAFGLTLVLGFTSRVLLRGPVEVTVSVSGGGLLLIPVLLGVFVAFFVLHEAIHGALFLLFGGKPRFGTKMVGRFFPVAFYATSGAPLSRNQYLVVALAPFILLTLAFLLVGMLADGEGAAAVAVLAAGMNAGGSIADLMAAMKIRRGSRDTLYQDTEDGFNWYVPSI